MKISQFIFLSIFASIFLIACSDDEETVVDRVEVQIPENFTIDIPNSISNNQNGSLSGRMEGDGDGIIEGNEIYEAVPYFIHLGEEASKIVEVIFPVATVLELANVSSVTYTSDEDGREKRTDLTNNVNRGGKSYTYELTTYDVLDNAQGLQMFWNVNPVEGVAILRPYDLNRSGDANPPAIIKIEYSEVSANYEATMIVSVSGIDPVVDGLDNLKLWAGRNGDVVDVIGNSNHPDLILFDENFSGGRNYAFVGRGNEVTDLGVINLALPPSNVTTNDILDSYSVYSVLFNEIDGLVGDFLTQQQIDDILAETSSPAFFNELGFITSGLENQPSGFTNEFIDISNLTPFIPNDIKTQQVAFINN